MQTTAFDELNAVCSEFGGIAELLKFVKEQQSWHRPIPGCHVKTLNLSKISRKPLQKAELFVVTVRCANRHHTCSAIPHAPSTCTCKCMSSLFYLPVPTRINRAPQTVVSSLASWRTARGVANWRRTLFPGSCCRFPDCITDKTDLYSRQPPLHLSSLHASQIEYMYSMSPTAPCGTPALFMTQYPPTIAPAFSLTPHSRNA